MSKHTEYVARLPDANGQLFFPQEEHAVWQALYNRQQGNLTQFACSEYQRGLENLNLSSDKIPQLTDIDKVLFDTTGWVTAAVPALISFEKIGRAHV